MHLGAPRRASQKWLAELWPKGFMDNHGIKRAICRAKERKIELYSRHKDQEKIKRKKTLTTKMETVPVEACSIGQPQLMKERLATDSGAHSLASTNKPISSTTASMMIPSPSAKASSLDWLKQEKLKGSSSYSMDEPMMVDGTITKKIVKMKLEQDFNGTCFHPEKLAAQSNEERQKSLNQFAFLPQKLNLNAPSHFEESS